MTTAKFKTAKQKIEQSGYLCEIEQFRPTYHEIKVFKKTGWMTRDDWELVEKIFEEVRLFWSGRGFNDGNLTSGFYTFWSFVR